MDNQLISEQKNKSAWIESLALEELNMEHSEIVHLNDHLNPIHLLEESSINFMNELRDQVEFYVNKFNEYRGGEAGNSQIKIFKISNTVNDFLLFRNSLRLVIARKANDLISVGFLSNGNDLYAARLNSDAGTPQTIHEIKAHIGPFNNISWKFQNEDIEIDALVRHYLSEFIRHSAR